MSWIYLIFAGLFEVVWANTLKLSQGFSQLGWSIATILGMIVSFLLLALSMKTLPLSIAYPVWTGIGAVGSIIIGVVFFHDKMSTPTWIFVALLVIALVGIKVTSSSH